MTTILAVDDSATMRKCLEITFAGTDLNLVSCDNAKAALEKLKALQPDLVIVDASLPPGDGYDLCATIKLAAPSTPVLMLTSKQHPFDAGRGAKAEGYVDKPFDTQALYDKAKSMVQPRQTGDTSVPKSFAAERMPAAPPSQQRPVAVPAAGKHPSNAPPRKAPNPSMLASMRDPAQMDRKSADLARKTVPFAVPSPGSPPVPQNLGKTSPGFGEPEVPARRSRELSRTMAFGEMPDRAQLARDLNKTVAFGEAPPTRPQPQMPLARMDAPAPMDPPPTTRGVQARQPSVADTYPGLQPDEELKAPPAEEPAPGVRPRRTTGSWATRPDEQRSSPGNVNGSFAARLEGLGLTAQQIDGVLALSREVVEQVVWEVVPALAETLIKEEIKRLTEE